MKVYGAVGEGAHQQRGVGRGSVLPLQVLRGVRGLGNGGKGEGSVLTVGSFPAHVTLHEGDDPNP